MVGVNDAGPEDQQQHREEESSDEEMVRALFQHFVKGFSVSWLAIMLFCMQDAFASVACRWHTMLNGSLQ